MIDFSYRDTIHLSWYVGFSKALTVFGAVFPLLITVTVTHLEMSSSLYCRYRLPRPTTPTFSRSIENVLRCEHFYVHCQLAKQNLVEPKKNIHS